MQFEIEMTDKVCKDALKRNLQKLFGDRRVLIRDVSKVARVNHNKLVQAFEGVAVLNVAEAARVASSLSVSVLDLIDPDFRLESERAQSAREAIRALAND